MPTCRHPSTVSQESAVQLLPSSQFVGGPPWHEPPPHVSFDVQGLSSSHGAVLFVFTHPDAGLQLSVVQTVPSLQSGAGPPAQAPPEH